MDVLSDVLRAVRLNGAIFFNNYVQAPFVGGSPHTATIADKVMPGAEHVIQFHALLQGSCWAVLTQGPKDGTHLNAGDIVIFPMGDGNIMSSSPGMHAEPNLDMYVRPPTDQHLPHQPRPYFVFTLQASNIHRIADMARLARTVNVGLIYNVVRSDVPDHRVLNRVISEWAAIRSAFVEARALLDSAGLPCLIPDQIQGVEPHLPTSANRMGPVRPAPHCTVRRASSTMVL